MILYVILTKEKCIFKDMMNKIELKKVLENEL